MKIIANPTAGFGKGKTSIQELYKYKINGDIEILETEGPLDANRIAFESVSAGVSRLGVLGGDGTIREVADVVAGSQIELAILSVGTGNDIARSLGLPYNNLEASLKIAQNGRSVPIDVGVVGGYHFLSVLGVGFPAQVAYESNNLKWLGGRLAFVAAIYKAVWKMEPITMDIELDNQSLSIDCTSLLILNTPFTGGGLKFAPNAKINDGLFDIVVVGQIGRLDLMASFPKVYTGNHLNHPSFSLFQSSSVKVSSSLPMEIMLDGDVYGEIPVEAEILSRNLNVVVG